MAERKLFLVGLLMLSLVALLISTLGLSCDSGHLLGDWQQPDAEELRSAFFVSLVLSLGCFLHGWPSAAAACTKYLLLPGAAFALCYWYEGRHTTDSPTAQLFTSSAAALVVAGLMLAEKRKAA